MQYNQPFGAATNAPYINGNPSTGTPGSIPPAAMMEYPQREIVNAITAAGLTPSNNDLYQLMEAIELLGKIPYCTDSGSVNHIVINPAPAISAYTTPQYFVVKLAYPNSSNVDVSVSGLPAKQLLMPSQVQIPEGLLNAPGLYLIGFDGTNFQLINGQIASIAPPSIPVIDLWHFGVDVSTVPNFVNVTTDSVGTSWSQGLVVSFICANTNTTSSNMELNGFSNVNITRAAGGALLPGDMQVGKISVVIFDGTQAQLLNPQGGTASIYVGTDVSVTANTMTVSTLAPALTTVLSGMIFDVTKGSVSNTGPIACTILTIEATVQWADGSALVSGDWPANTNALIQYDGTHYNILSVIGPTVWQRNTPIGLRLGTDTGAANAAVVASLSPATTSITVGQLFEITKSSAPNSSTMTLAVMGTSGALQWADGSALAPNDWPASCPALISWNGTVYSLHSVMGPSVFARVSSAPSGYSGLLIQNYSGSPNSTLAITADSLTLPNSAGVTVRLQSVSVQINNASSGAGGIDTGSCTASTAYELYVGYNPTTRATAAWATIEGNATTPPSGYTYYKRFGWQRVDASKNWWKIIQRDTDWQYVIQAYGSTNTTCFPDVVVGGFGTFEGYGTQVSLVGVVPLKSNTAMFIFGALALAYNQVFIYPNASYNYAWDYGGYVQYMSATANSWVMTNVVISQRCELTFETPATVWADSQSAGLCQVTGGRLSI